MADRISNLPDGVAHHVLSFVTITDLTRFGCASKRCRQLYLSNPSLNFDGFSDQNMSAFPNQLKVSSVDRLLIHRGANKIQRFRIYWYDNCLKKGNYLEDVNFRMMTWIHYAVRCNVEVLELDVRIPIFRSYSFPSCVFLCGSLRSLFLRMRCKILKAPSLSSSSNLEYLKLSDITIEDEGIFKWISSSCKCIKELHLDHVKGICNVTVDSSSLKLFSFMNFTLSNGDCHLRISCEKLEDIFISWGNSFTGSKLLNIVAPNLKVLVWYGNLSIHQNLGELMCLEEAILSLKTEAHNLNFLSEVLCSICRVETLLLNKETTMALFKGGSRLGLLENVSRLCINIGNWVDIIIQQMVSIFGVMNNLRALNIVSDPLFLDPETDCCGFDMGYWGTQNLPFIHQLKEVTVELSNGSNGIEFVKYILEHAQNLKKMKIVHSPQQSIDVTELKKSELASNIATVVFEEVPKRGTRMWRRNI